MTYDWFIQFTFDGILERSYWFPLIFKADSGPAALDMAKRYETALAGARYRNIGVSKPEKLLDGINAEPVRSYIERRLKGKVVLLEAQHWKIRALDTTSPDLTFDEQLQLVSFTPPLGTNTISLAYSNELHVLPVRVVREGILPDIDDFLLIDVVKP